MNLKVSHRNPIPSYEKAARRFPPPWLAVFNSKICLPPTRALQSHGHGLLAHDSHSGLACGGNVWDGTVAHFNRTFPMPRPDTGGLCRPTRDRRLVPRKSARRHYHIYPRTETQPPCHDWSQPRRHDGFLGGWETAPAEVGPIIAVDGVPFFPALMVPAATHESSLPMAGQFRSMYAGLTTEQFIDNYRQFLSMLITASSQSSAN